MSLTLPLADEGVRHLLVRHFGEEGELRTAASLAPSTLAFAFAAPLEEAARSADGFVHVSAPAALGMLLCP